MGRRVADTDTDTGAFVNRCVNDIRRRADLGLVRGADFVSELDIVPARLAKYHKSALIAPAVTRHPALAGCSACDQKKSSSK